MKKKSSILVSIVCVLCVLCVLTSCGHTHAYKESVISPTCNTQGYTLHKCSCGAEYKDNFVDAAHDYTFTVILPTCTEQGYTLHVCKKCGNEYKDNMTEASGHTYKKTVINPTCTKNGYTLNTCEKCGNEYKDDETEAFGHTYKQTIVKPTCTQKGYTLYTCEKCGNKYRDNETNALKHSYVGTITKPATTSSTGEKTYKCSVCGYTYTEIIPKINTDWEIEEILDEFGDKTGRKRLLGTFNGTYKSSYSTTERACTITASVYFMNGKFDFFFEYVYIGSSSSYMLTEAKSGSLTTKNSDGTKKKYSLTSGSVIPYNYSEEEPDADELINDIKNNKQIECVMYASGSKNTYTFTMNNADFTNILNKYLGN